MSPFYKWEDPPSPPVFRLVLLHTEAFVRRHISTTVYDNKTLGPVSNFKLCEPAPSTTVVSYHSVLSK